MAKAKKSVSNNRPSHALRVVCETIFGLVVHHRRLLFMIFHLLVHYRMNGRCLWCACNCGEVLYGKLRATVARHCGSLLAFEILVLRLGDG